MNGGDVLCRTLLDNQIDTCFANPGTSEMHFVASLDKMSDMRCVLCLFEGVATGAADGYARMTGRPAATLLHTGPGLANGLANLHNARRARTPMLNIIGDHADSHIAYDAPLTTDIEALARPVSDWVGRTASAVSVQADAMQAIQQARQAPGQVSVLVFPADAAWGDSQYQAGQFVAAPQPDDPATEAIQAAVEAIRSDQRCLLLLGGAALRHQPLLEAARIAESHGVGVLAEQGNARMQQGMGTWAPDRIEYGVDGAVRQLAEYDVIILVGARAPVAFFKYPGKPHQIAPPEATILTLSQPSENALEALRAVRTDLGIAASLELAPMQALAVTPVAEAAPLNAMAVVQIAAATLPDHTIVCDEAISHSTPYGKHLRFAKPHDLLQLTGGAIGIGPSLAVGAAIACPDRQVLSLQADGAGAYAVQALWTQAREGLNVVTIILANQRYQSLYDELIHLGHGEPGRNARNMLNLDGPALDWVSIAQGFGARGMRVHTGEALQKALVAAYAEAGPVVIEAVI